MFEFDQKKSESNLVKHGIDFNEAQKLWSDSKRVEIKARTTTEPRFIVIGMVGVKVWSAVIPYRVNQVRIISVRRARPKERDLYGCN